MKKTLVAATPRWVLLGKTATYLTTTKRSNSTLHFIIFTIVTVFWSIQWLNGTGYEELNSVFNPVGGRHFLFKRVPLTRSEEVKLFFPTEEDAGYMAPVGLVPELIYDTEYRFFAMPFFPDNLDLLIKAYNIRYLVFTDRYLKRHDSYLKNCATSREVPHYIVSHAEKYQKIGEWQQQYPDCYPTTTFYLYQVRNR